MTDIRVDYGVVASAQDNINGGSTNIGNTLEGMDSDLRPLVEQWTGEASTAYHNAKADWSKAINSMNDTLQQIKGLLGDSASDFNSTDIAGANRFGG